MDNINTLKYTEDSSLKEEIKKHYLKRDNNTLVNVGVVSDKNKYQKIESKDESDEINSKTSYFEKIKYRLALKVFGALSVIAIFFAYNYFPEEVQNNKICLWVKDKYNSEYTKSEVIEKIEDISLATYLKIQKIIPENMYLAVTNKYINDIKPKIINFDLSSLKLSNNSIENTVTVFNESDIVFENNDITLAEEAITTSSQISLMGMDLDEIKSKNINIALPVTGIVTSTYGAREEIFKNVGYHTGVDIANSLNTPVSSATTGKVVKTQSMDKYYGNNIEIETDGVIFKYAHLNQINVSEGDNVSQGDIIGLMGSTGASTGSHLHFEIKINGRTVDPELLVKIR